MTGYMIPNVIAQNPRGDRVMDVYSHLLTERVIYLGTPIDAGVANAIVAQLLFLESDNADRDIQLYINCEGGDPSAMLAIYDTMRYVRPHVATTCIGQAVAVGAAGGHQVGPGWRLPTIGRCDPLLARSQAHRPGLLTLQSGEICLLSFGGGGATAHHIDHVATSLCLLEI